MRGCLTPRVHPEAVADGRPSWCFEIIFNTQRQCVIPRVVPFQELQFHQDQALAPSSERPSHSITSSEFQSFQSQSFSSCGQLLSCGWSWSVSSDVSVRCCRVKARQSLLYSFRYRVPQLTVGSYFFRFQFEEKNA